MTGTPAKVDFTAFFPSLAPAQDETILREAGFSNPTLFYTRLRLPRLGGLRLNDRETAHPHRSTGAPAPR
ncbi:hypothetical protein CO669_21975 [Bradyrhizobium sp. Y36]|nr:hypothetical protein CO669_21975 [Bradyrhizobium sp. Y36]